MEPHELAGHETVHVTPFMFTSLTRVAVNCSDALSTNIAVVLLRETLMGAVCTVGTLAPAPPQPRFAAVRVAARNRLANAARVFGDIAASVFQFSMFLGCSREEGTHAPGLAPNRIAI
jgi:hypothetical protein